MKMKSEFYKCADIIYAFQSQTSEESCEVLRQIFRRLGYPLDDKHLLLKLQRLEWLNMFAIGFLFDNEENSVMELPIANVNRLDWSKILAIGFNLNKEKYKDS